MHVVDEAVSFHDRLEKTRYDHDLSSIPVELCRTFTSYTSKTASERLVRGGSVHMKEECVNVMNALSEIEMRLESARDHPAFATENIAFIDKHLEKCRLYMQVVRMVLEE